ncbi:putative trans-sulfuration enzyme [Pyrenophora seminiperda CCB06]|uniref:Putative trans-sulfuration enzyme n=1 Tax=Pyrenophora seminiperda CCB06 TaxID=1302712 RepID=A0A3M7M1Z2_9PLEO|nr:putative trans-sulfuration enzyme [Pyrenophora seminiperda CCB06]
MVDAQDAGSKLFSKSRWKTKILEKTAEIQAANQAKTARTPDDDLNAFLRPSTDKVAQQQKDAAAAIAGFSRPRIDVASAQRWPSAHVILANAAAKSPGPGGMKTGTRKKGLTVAFVRTVPEVIGHGGDECEDPTIDVSQKKKAASASQVEKPPVQVPQDDANVTARSNGIGRTPSQTEYRTTLTRTNTNPGELSPPLGQKMQIGQINSTAQLPPTPPRYMGSMGLGERPKPLSRAPTGFDIMLESATADRGRRPSQDSVYSQDSDNFTPALSRALGVPEPTIQEEDDFQPKPLKRTQTGFSMLGGDDDDTHEPVHPIPSVPHMPEQRLAEHDEDGPNSFAARVKQRMRSEEGRTLHEAAQRAAESESERRDSESSSQPSMAGTPPSSYRTPATSRAPQESSHMESAASTRPMDYEDPHRSRATQGIRLVGHGIQTEMEPRSPSVASSQYTPFSPQSQPRSSPPVRSEPFSNAGLQRITSTTTEPTFQPVDIGSNPPTPPQLAQQEPFFEAAQPPPPFNPQVNPQVRAISGQPASEVPSRNVSGASMKPATSLARSDTKSINEAAYQDFAERVTHMRGIFQLTAQLGGNIHSHSPMQWLRVATWWFLKGRTGMENMIRNQPRNGEPPQERLAQPHVDLAKVWWIITEVLPNHPGLQSYGDVTPNAQVDLARQAGDAAGAEAYDIQNALSHYMKLLVGSMKKHQSMPPTQALIQGQDQSIWEEYPTFPGDAASVLGQPQNGQPPFILSQCIPLADTKNDFCYFRMFVKASMSTDDPSTDRVPMNAVMSVLRSKQEYQVKLSICSQNSLINVQVGSGLAVGWKDVNWKQQAHQITVQLRHGFLLTLALHEVDFRSLWSIINHTNRVESDIRERKDERFASKIYLREASYRDPASPGAFAPDRVKDCKLLVFQRIERSSEGTGKRKLHRGYRMVLVTPQHVKQVSVINHEFGTKHEPMNFEYVTEPDQAPALKLRFREEGPDKKLRTCTAHLVFHDSRERNDIFGTFTSMNVVEGETTFAQVALKAYHIESADQAEGFSQQGSRVLEKLQWVEAKVVNQDPEAAGLESAPTVMSESLRIMCRHTAGIISDRMNLGPGELLVRLPVDGTPELTLLREAQQDFSVAVDASRTEPNVPDALAELIKTLTSSTTIRRLTFNSYQDLHTFQLAVTGFNVKFDGLACTFSISRRRMVVPIYKQWTATRLRLQIVEQDNITQLLAFFEDFSHADAMNFQLRTMDTFEKTEKGGKFGLKLVDAKFALPVDERRGEGKIQKAEGRLTGWSGTKRRFVCLDEVEYPGEHDDILIMFDRAETRDRFADALPAATMERKFTVRRKI